VALDPTKEPWWKPRAITGAMCLLVAANLGILAYSIFHQRDQGGDVAESGLAATFEMASFLARGTVIAILASLFLIIVMRERANLNHVGCRFIFNYFFPPLQIEVFVRFWLLRFYRLVT